jgi:sialate O-acetylesterase
MKYYSILLIFFCTALTLSAQVKLAPIFSDNMVLQREKPISVWGWVQNPV